MQPNTPESHVPDEEKTPLTDSPQDSSDETHLAAQGPNYQQSSTTEHAVALTNAHTCSFGNTLPSGVCNLARKNSALHHLFDMEVVPFHHDSGILPRGKGALTLSVIDAALEISREGEENGFVRHLQESTERRRSRQ